MTHRSVGSKAIFGAQWGAPCLVTIVGVVREDSWCPQSHLDYYYVVTDKSKLKFVTTEEGLSDT